MPFGSCWPRRYWAILIASTLLGVGSNNSSAEPHSGLTASQIAAIDGLGNRSVSGGFTPSIVIGVKRYGKTIYLRAFGYRNVESKSRALDSTPYMVGSNQKQFTAAAILRLQEEGKLDVDDRLSKYLPQIPHSKDVTLRQLLTMSSGYADYIETPAFQNAMRHHAGSPARAVALVKVLPLDFRPGTRWSYCNTGYTLLQMVVERVAAMPFTTYLQRQFFTPLGMHASYLQLSRNRKPDVAAEYTSFALGPWEPAPYWDYSWISATGGLVSDVADLEKWNAALDGGKILSPRSLAQMFEPGPAASTPGGDGYGMGIRLGELPNGHHYIAHGGNTTGSSTQDARFPDDHLSIIILTNAPNYTFNKTMIAVYNIVIPEAAVMSAQATPAPVPMPSDPHAQAALQWLNDAIAGHADASNATGDMRALLTPSHRAALRALSRFGPRTFDFDGVDRRKPTTQYAFIVHTAEKQFSYSYKWDDDGKLADVQIQEILSFAASK